MHFCQFVFFRNSATSRPQISDADHRALVNILESTPRLTRALILTPSNVDGPFSGDEGPPTLALQLYFPELSDLESQIARGGHLQLLATPGRLPSLEATVISHQVMLTRPFPTPPAPAWSPGDPPRCTYLVHYPGRAEDMNAWLGHYVSHHPQLMYGLPGIREIEIYTRVDWWDQMPWKREDRMQRNKVVFDSPEALSAALHSDALLAMRSDYHSFPPFTGGNVHYPMLTTAVDGGG